MRKPTSEPLRRAAMILELVALEPSGLTISQMSERLCLPQATVFRIVQKLVGLGLMEGAGRHVLYRVGPRLHRIAELLSSSEAFSSLAGDVMQGVADELHLSVFLASLFESESTFIMTKFPKTVLTSFVHPGPQYAVHASAAGKVLLAYQPPAAQESFFKDYVFTSFTERTITNRTRMMDEMSRIREVGFGTSVGESDHALWGLAYPVGDLRGNVVYAIGVVGLRNDPDRNELDARVHETVRSAAARLEQLFKRPASRS